MNSWHQAFLKDILVQSQEQFSNVSFILIYFSEGIAGEISEGISEEFSK